MPKIIKLGSSAILNKQTCRLIRTHDGAQVRLPASACRCLKALAEAVGETLSQEALMEIGWRRAGVEATDNSVRVMISKLRRALTVLDLDKHLALLTVTRTGYRLIVHANASPVPVLPPPAAFHTLPSPPATRPPRSRKIRFWAAALAGILAGVLVGFVVQRAYFITLKQVDFVAWHGNSIPEGYKVWVQKGEEHKQAMIETTLRTYARYVLAGPAKTQQRRVLYITLGDSSTHHHQGVIACQHSFQDSNNACESFYFRFH